MLEARFVWHRTAMTLIVVVVLLALSQWIALGAVLVTMIIWSGDSKK
jgi:hypothetical protein